MTGPIAPTGYGLIARLIQNGTDVRQRLTTLTTQASSGFKSETYAGLGAGLPTSLSLKPRIDAIAGWQSNIDAATGRMEVTQSSMKQIQSIAADLMAKLSHVNGLNATGIDAIAANARSALGDVAHFLNAQDATGYVFAGQDTANPPVPEAADMTGSAFYQQIAANVAGLGASGATATAAATLATATTVSPFSTWLSQPAAALTVPSVQVGQDETRPAGLLASTNLSAVSAGSSTTGSHMRDLLRALATIGAMVGSQANDPGLGALVQDTRTSLTGAIEAMAVDAGVFGDRQAALTTTRSRLDDLTTASANQLANAQEVDMAATLSNIALVQTQLQASYQLIVKTNSLSLMQFLQ